MKYEENIAKVSTLPIDYMGFIFYEKSSRFMVNTLPKIPHHIEKIGVFVNASISFILNKVKAYELQGIQLHGNESVKFCDQLQSELIKLKSNIKLIKVFSIKSTFNFNSLLPYDHVIDHYLFDTKGDLPGGNGYTFNWEILKEYPLQKSFFLSGGISINHVSEILEFNKSLPVHAIDINSKFEVNPGLKNPALLKTFINEIKKTT